MLPFCHHAETAVVTRGSGLWRGNRRRRVCDHCHRRFTTYEKVEGLDLKVIKKMAPEKSLIVRRSNGGSSKPLGKRPVTIAQIDEVLTDVEEAPPTRRQGN